MTCWIKLLSSLFSVFGVIILIACNSSEQNFEHTEKHGQELLEAQLIEPPNCPVIIAAYVSKNKLNNDQVGLSFQIEENPNFDSVSGDACEGNIKNLWPDLKRHSKLIEEHSQNLRHIYGFLGRNLDYFPITKADVKRYVDEAATAARLKEKLNSYDRNSLEGGLKIAGDSRTFLYQTLQSYLDQEHKPIIENILVKTKTKMGRFQGEKLQFCYKSFNRCEYLVTRTKTSQNEEFDFEFFGVAFDWWGFERNNQENME